MKEIEKLFFELIRIALGNQVCLSRTPNESEWGELYAMAKKQSLVGVCFAGVKKLKDQHQAPPEMLYLTWLGMAAKIQQRNEVVSRQCVDLCDILKKKGFRSCILKGQGTSLLYESLSMLRQSGDIDVWIMPNNERFISGCRDRINHFIHERFPDMLGTLIHIDFPIFNDTEVEIHYMPTMDGNPRVNRILIDLFENRQDVCFNNINNLGFSVLETNVNVLYNLHHIKRHFINEGIGLRHVLDMYYVLRSAKNENLDCLIESLKFNDFLSGLVWVMQTVLGEVPKSVNIQPNKRLGQFLLGEIMRGGNFGHHDERLKGLNDMGFIERWMHYFEVLYARCKYFPSDVFWSYIFRLKYSLWKRL